MRDMRVIKLVNKTQQVQCGMNPGAYKFVWFNYKFVDEYGYDIVNAINSDKFYICDYQNVEIPNNIGSTEVTNLIQEVLKEEDAYFWNMNIGHNIICKFRRSAAISGVTYETSPIVFAKLKLVTDYLLLGMLKEAAVELAKVEVDEVMTASVKEFFITLMTCSDAS
jgi:hypothetical protein